MVAATAVIGAVSATVGTINTIKTWVESLERFVRDFKEAGELLLGLQNSIQKCEFRLHLWWTFWELDGASGPYMRELWGSGGTKTIVSQLTTIESLCNKFHKALDSFFGDTTLAQVIYNARGSDAETPSGRLAVFQAYAKTIKLTSSNTKIFNFTRTLNSRALTWLSLMGTQLAELESDALRAYNIRHQQEAKTFLTQEQMNVVHAGVLMQMAMDHRVSTEELFQNCFNLEAKMNMLEPRRNMQCSLQLKVDLMTDSSELQSKRASSAQDIIERYHILLKQEQQGGGPTEAELCILRSVPEAPQSQIHESILEAYQTALKDRIPTRAVCQGMMFCFRPPLEDERLISGHRAAIPLKELLKCETTDTFLLQDRIHLAYKIVECGSLLTGTSWLASLRTDHVMRSRSQAGFYYTLDIKLPTSEISRKSLAAHIVRIGAFLIEIGTGMSLKDTPSQGHGMLFKLEAVGIHAPQTRGSGLYTKEEVKSILTQNVGDSYASAALYCFGLEIGKKCKALVDSHSGAIFESYKEVLKDYYLNIYSPIQALEDRWNDIQFVRSVLLLD